MAKVRNAILATLAYYDVFEFPLTLVEIYKYLVNPGRVENLPEGIGEIKVSDILNELDNLKQGGRVVEHNGFYFLSADRISIYNQRIEREKLAAQKWKKLMRVVRWFPLVPHLRGVFVSGSLAINNTNEESDFDVLVIAKSGRLYTCRFFLSLLTSIFGVRRTRHDTKAPDKLCFNHYLTDANMTIPYESLYNAQTYVNLKPVFVREGVWVKFFLENLWLNKYVYHPQTQEYLMRRTVHSPAYIRVVNALAETVLNTFAGDLVEKLNKRFQQRRIRLNPVTYAPGGRTVFTDQQLEFHPHSEERNILEQYNRLIADIGTFWNYQEVDSGLL
ncbi:MAG TPA: hypothetical protein VEK36_01340 [Candidatus Paceibacterota bacterium]|nr:hypothetical protein [Candidatus Paceibacterota bacterium]